MKHCQPGLISRWFSSRPRPGRFEKHGKRTILELLELESRLAPASIPFNFNIPAEVAGRPGGIYMAMFGQLQENYTPTFGPSAGMLIGPGGASNSSNVYLVESGGNYDYAAVTHLGGVGNVIPTFLTTTTALVNEVVNIPNPQIQGARVIIGVGSPPTLLVNSAAGDVTAPTPANQPNNIYDFFEFSYLQVAGQNTLTINTSAIDQFGFPIDLVVTDDSNNTSQVGVLLSRNEVLGEYQTYVQGTPFAQGGTDAFGNPSTLRILSPGDVLLTNPVAGLEQNPGPGNAGTLTSGGQYYYAVTAVDFDVNATGTITSTGTTVSGVGTKFLTEVKKGDLIGNSANGYAVVTAIASDTQLTLASAFPNGDILAAAAFQVGKEATVNDQVLIATASSTGEVYIAWSPPTLAAVDYYKIYRAPVGSTVSWSLAGVTPVNQLAGNGTISSTGTTVTGVGTSFGTQFNVGQLIGNSTIGFSLAAAVASSTSLTLANPFPGGDASNATFNFVPGAAYDDLGGTILSNVSPPFDPLSTFFDKALSDFIAEYSDSGLSLTVTDGSGTAGSLQATANGIQYTFSGQVVANPADLQGLPSVPANNTVVQFTLASIENPNNLTPLLPPGTKFYIFVPYFNTNTYDSSNPSPPTWLPSSGSNGNNVSASAMVFAASGVFADNSGQAATLLPQLQNAGILPSAAAPTALTGTVGSNGSLPAGAYFYAVTAVTSAGESVASNVFNIAVGSAGSNVNLSWGGVAGATQYKIYRGTAANQINQLVGTSTSAAFNDKGTSATAGFPPVLDPNAYSVALGALENQINAALTRGIATDSPNQPAINPVNWANAPTGLETPTPASGALPAGTYYYIVTTVVDLGGGQTSESTASNEVSATVNGSQGLQLSWKPVGNASKYRIYRGTASGQENLLLAEIDGMTGSPAQPNTTYTDSGSYATGFPLGKTPPVYYPAGSTSSLYAQFFHQTTVSHGGLAYASPYDDQGGQSSTITAVISGTGAGQVVVNLGPWDTSVQSSTADHVAGQPLIINGAGFNPTPGGNIVTLSSGAGSVTHVNANGTQLTFTFTTPPALGPLTAVVSTVNGGSSGAAVQVANVVADVSGPVVNITKQPGLNSAATTATFAFTATDNAWPSEQLTYAVSIDGGAYSTFGGQTTAAFTGLALGSHTFAVKAMDPGGLESAPVTYTWTVAAVAEITLESGGDQSAVVGAPFGQDLVFTVTDALGQPLSDAEVHFLVTPSSTGAAASIGDAISSSTGQVVATALANVIVGSYTVKAKSGTAASDPFTLTNTTTVGPLTLTGPKQAKAGKPFKITVTGPELYQGTVTFGGGKRAKISTEKKGTYVKLKTFEYTFTFSDHNVKEFWVKLGRPFGKQTVRVSDTEHPENSDKIKVRVRRAGNQSASLAAALRSHHQEEEGGAAPAKAWKSVVLMGGSHTGPLAVFSTSLPSPESETDPDNSLLDTLFAGLESGWLE